MTQHQVLSRDEWAKARTALLEREKQFTRVRDELSQARRELPWVRVDKNYVFDGPSGKVSLRDLFEGRSQLLVYHFMFDPDWNAGCKSCSFWADNFNGIGSHLAQRDVTFAAVSRAPLPKLTAFAKRLGWSFKWVSSNACDFNYDFGVSFTSEAIATGKVHYNYNGEHKAYGAEMPGISVFFRDADGAIYHTYSCYARGLDMLNGAYHYLDLVPKGRDEDALPFTMSWLKLRDEYAS
jgi:predicted dithiol-disulfide oxidoreductase (DUF899 family)